MSDRHNDSANISAAPYRNTLSQAYDLFCPDRLIIKQIMTGLICREHRLTDSAIFFMGLSQIAVCPACIKPTTVDLRTDKTSGLFKTPLAIPLEIKYSSTFFSPIISHQISMRA